jgi:hypothetical protein
LKRPKDFALFRAVRLKFSRDGSGKFGLFLHPKVDFEALPHGWTGFDPRSIRF